MKSTVETLRNAKARIEKGWCRGVLARNSKGEETTPNGPDAVRWCAFGAIGTTDEALGAADRALIMAHGNYYVAEWNDEPEREVEDVLRLFDRAIALAESGAV